MCFFHLKWKWQFSNFNFLLLRQKKKLSTFFPIFDKTRNLKWKPWNLPRLFNSMSSFPFHPLSQNPPSIKTSSKEIFLFIKNPAPSLLNLSWKALTLKLFNENFFWIKKHFLEEPKSGSQRSNWFFLLVCFEEESSLLEGSSECSSNMTRESKGL